MLGFINKTANRLLEQEKHRKNEMLKVAVIEKSEELPTNGYTLPDEGTLTFTADVLDMMYMDPQTLIEPTINCYYYNSCVCVYNDKYRLFYRCGKNPKTCEDRIATCLLTKDFKVVPNTNKYVNVFSNWQASRDAGPDSLDRHIRYYYHETKEVKSFIYKDGQHVEDPRVIEFQGHWYMLYTDGMTMAVAKLDYDTCDVIYSHFLPVPTSNLLSKQFDGREKNWIPVVSNNALYILYSDTPRTFIRCVDAGTHLQLNKYNKLNYVVMWHYGAIRGGCPPIEYDRDSLIWFFHSSKEVYHNISIQNSKIYFIGAYITSKEYPFHIYQITKFPIFFGTPSPLRQGMSYQTNVVFPCGAVCVGNDFVISMGINDYCIGHLKVKREEILWKPFEKHLTHLNVTTLS
jgi:predicted GH43/DUF377 family glycosyl hydrolase